MQESWCRKHTDVMWPRKFVLEASEKVQAWFSLSAPCIYLVVAQADEAEGFGGTPLLDSYT